MTIQTGRTKNEAEAHDGETIRFLVDVPGHSKGEVCTLLHQTAMKYVNRNHAELLPRQ
jgi:hypothetical protein